MRNAQFSCWIFNSLATVLVIFVVSTPPALAEERVRIDNTVYEDREALNDLVSEMLEYSSETCGISIHIRVPSDSFPSKNFETPFDLANRINREFGGELKTPSKVFISEWEVTNPLFTFYIHGHLFANDLDQKHFSVSQFMEIHTSIAIVSHSVKSILLSQYSELLEVDKDILDDSQKILDQSEKILSLSEVTIRLANGSIREKQSRGEDVRALIAENNLRRDEYRSDYLELEVLRSDLDQAVERYNNTLSIVNSLNCDFVSEEHLFDADQVKSIENYVRGKEEESGDTPPESMSLGFILEWIIENGFSTPLHRANDN